MFRRSDANQFQPGERSLGSEYHSPNYERTVNGVPVGAQFPITPLCMNIQGPQANGWQFGRVMGVPVEARTWAK